MCGNFTKKTIRNILKYVISLGIAFIILTAFCFFYSNIPVHYKCTDGATDYVWKANEFYSIGTEGFSWGKTNNEGYQNILDYNENTNVDILIMGSSHMEARQVAMKESTAGLLNSMLEENVYNIGTSGHTFLTCVSNLEAAIKKYNPTDYIIIETDSVTFSNDNIESTIKGNLEEIESYNEGIIGILQQNQFLRLLYSQIEILLSNNISNDVEEKDILNTRVDEKKMDELFYKINADSSNSSAKIIIVYHPSIYLDYDGKMNFNHNEKDVELFAKICEKNDIYFLDMSERFNLEYMNNNIIPYGFNNSTIGTGHLNKYGHAMIADELYKVIKEVE